MSFFEPKIVKKVKEQREQLKINIEKYRESTRKLDEEEVKKIKPEIQKHYMEQLEKPLENREWFSRDGADYIVFLTDDEEIVVEGESKNTPKETSTGNIYIWCQFPLMTREDSSFPARVKIFVSADDFSFATWKTLILAKGRMKVQYKQVGDSGYAKPLKTFLKEQGVDELEELDFAEYIRDFTFNVDQVLEQTVMK